MAKSRRQLPPELTERLKPLAIPGLLASDEARARVLGERSREFARRLDLLRSVYRIEPAHAAQRTGFGSAGAWRWALPIPKVIIEAKDAHTKMVSTNGQNEHLCTREPPAQSAGGDSEAL